MTGKKPNIILIITDNQSADLLGCYGNDEIHSPHLDRLAAEGIRFDNAFCPNAMCSPCRASIFTGRMPCQHGVHTWIDDRQRPNWPENWNAVEEFDTLSEVIKRGGYSTALIGKYHLGVPTPGHNEIDYWVTMERGHTLDFHDNMMNVNGEIVRHQGHSVEFFTDQTIEYLDQQSDVDQPFMLTLAYNGPYGHWPSIKGVPDNRFFDLYRDADMHSVPREGISRETIALYDLQKHLGGKGGPDFSAVIQIPNDLTSLRNYYSQMSVIDDGIGKIIDALDRNSMAEDTIIIFTADHGFSLGQHGFWGHGQSTWPSNTFRNAFNIPLIIRAPGIASNGSVSQAFVSSMDLYSTIPSLLGIASSKNQDGLAARDFSRLVTENNSDDWEDVIFHEQEETRSIRTREWLYMMRFSRSETYPLSNELYDLTADPDERKNLAGDTSYISVEKELSDRISDYFVELADPRYDLWNGGTVKSNTSRPWLWQDAWTKDWVPTH